MRNDQLIDVKVSEDDDLSDEQELFFGESDASDEDSFGIGNLDLSEFSEDSTFERVSVNDEEDEDDCNGGFYFGSDEDSSIDPTDSLPIPNSLPCWFCNEDPHHVEFVVHNYEEELISENEFQRSHQPFVGSICRAIVDLQSQPLQTFDTVLICNNQRMPNPLSPMPSIRTVYLLSSW
eukprot:CAMPEP_0206158614 /NCGR_PEP_ID=MMETSP1474-20131121/5014_1 /ASSEMBLY_ACC=CAM_ASM_001110 /TAXON_ID=97495 /ORGANISM="Imantonia sp., Strain RCC918" /LENGTH=177 /DNA_ID=CAMNT_0053558791 /DNA_START=51 /DNA_END=581 /DNA_ORIENTATION=-